MTAELDSVIFHLLVNIIGFCASLVGILTTPKSELLRSLFFVGTAALFIMMSTFS